MGCCNSANPDEPIEIEAVEAVRANEAIEEATDDFINPYTHIPSQFYSIEHVAQATTNFSENLIVGRGGFGNVYTCVIDGIPAAVKRLIEGSQQGNPEFENELNFLSTMKHVNVIRLMGYSVSHDEKIIIYEYMSNNSLASFLQDDDRRRHLDWSRRVEIIKGIADGLSYLHNDATVNLIHRDIKAANILLDDRMVAKIADFGTAKNVNDDNPSSPKGTVGYWDPQYYAYGVLSTKSDVYSFGVIVLEMLTGRKCVQGDGTHISSMVWIGCLEGDWMNLADASLERNPLRRQDFGRMLNIGMLCVQNDVELRPSSKDLVNMLESSDTRLARPREPTGVASKRFADRDEPMLPDFQV